MTAQAARVLVTAWRAEADRLDAFLADRPPLVPAYVGLGDRAHVQARALTLREKADELERAAC